jgi:hypothetical protein
LLSFFVGYLVRYRVSEAWRGEKGGDMPVVKIMLDPESFKTLASVAFEERRPVLWQAEVLLLRALGRWPMPDDHVPGAAEVSDSILILGAQDEEVHGS